MCRRSLSVLLCAVVLVALSLSVCVAQITSYPSPDSGVKGSGAIRFGVDGKIGAFDINVARAGNLLLGGFKFSEISPTSVSRGNVIYSRTIESLEVRGNFATVKAVGYWNNMLCNIQVEALDDNPCGDWFRIVARPFFLDIIYEAAGGVIRGDIVVFSNPVPDCFAKGIGAIAASSGVGRFDFNAVKTGGVVKGRLFYSEYLFTANSIRPRVSIYLPAVAELRVSGLVGTFSGIGRLNGVPARIEVRVVDWSPTYRRADEFYIKAMPLAVDVLSAAGYQAGGPLVAGELTVGTSSPVEPAAP